ncbi:MAG: hypothetical protein JWM58_953 [Rhizobium sp.]|nr:hypothetical protein [Rhizobium sp.]
MQRMREKMNAGRVRCHSREESVERLLIDPMALMKRPTFDEPIRPSIQKFPAANRYPTFLSRCATASSTAMSRIIGSISAS